MGKRKAYRQDECVYCHKWKFMAAHGLCRACYQYQQRNGTLVRKTPKPRMSCSVTGCGAFVVSKGFCERHRIRERRSTEPRELSKHPEAIASRKWRKENFLKAKSKDLKKYFGITLDQYNEMLAVQNGVCAICEKKDIRVHRATRLPMNLAVDHCHTTKKVRGLLCGPCNHGIGNFNDDVLLIRKAISYLESH